MMLTNWGNTNGNSMSEGSNVIADESMWFKILGQWIVLAMYVRILQLAYVENNSQNGYIYIYRCMGYVCVWDWGYVW